jgi:hypothetical protein
MTAEQKLPVEIQDALSKGLLDRIPLTFLPFVNQQLNQWDYLFPNERQSVERLLLYVASLSQEQSADLFRNVVELEDKMGVRHWQFSTTEQTIQNSSQLASSQYFQDWRRAVQAVFDAADAHALENAGASSKSGPRLVLLDIPQNLPVDKSGIWHRWQGAGRAVRLDLSQSGEPHKAFERLIAGVPNGSIGQSAGLLDTARNRSNTSPADIWVVDAGRSLVDAVLLKDAPASTQQWEAGSLPPKLLPRNELHAQGPCRRGRGIRSSAQGRCRPMVPSGSGRRPGNARIRAFSLSHRKRRRHFRQLLCRVGGL